VWIFKGEILNTTQWGSEKRALEGTDFLAPQPGGLSEGLREINNAVTQAHQVPQGFKGRISGHLEGRGRCSTSALSA
jgi:hypothetical protein